MMNKTFEWAKIAMSFIIIFIVTHGITLSEEWKMVIMAICGVLIGSALVKLSHKPKNTI